jgi:hypothetical protein
MTADFVRTPPDPCSNRSLRRQREHSTRVPVGIIRRCNRCYAEYQPEHKGAFFCSACWEVMRWRPYAERLQYA